MESLIQELQQVQEQPCVSLYLHLLPGAARVQDNVERFMRAFDDVEGRLQGEGLSPKGQKQFLASARTFAQEQLPASTDGGAMALFLSPSFFRAVSLKRLEEESTMIGESFQCEPLLQSMAGAESLSF